MASITLQSQSIVLRGWGGHLNWHDWTTQWFGSGASAALAPARICTRKVLWLVLLWELPPHSQQHQKVMAQADGFALGSKNPVEGLSGVSKRVGHKDNTETQPRIMGLGAKDLLENRHDANGLGSILILVCHTG